MTPDCKIVESAPEVRGTVRWFRLCGEPKCMNRDHIEFVSAADGISLEGVEVLRQSLEESVSQFNAMQEYRKTYTQVADIESLKQSISEMDDDAIMQRILEIRTNRRQGGATAKPSKAKRDKQNVDLTALVKSMTPEQKAAFIAQLTSEE